jgi:tRNA threonylcarbamoyladenosine biosynthesis protein TsaE
VALSGPLGAGKTLLTKGIAAGLGLRDTRCVTSPTFVLVQHYDCGPLRLHHIDAYRLQGAWDLIEIGIDDLFTRNAVTVIEWPERVGDLLTPPHLRVDIEILGSSTRALTFRARNGFPRVRIEALRKALAGGSKPKSN